MYSCLSQITQITEALSYLHDLSIIHGDIKGVGTLAWIFICSMLTSSSKFPEQHTRQWWGQSESYRFRSFTYPSRVWFYHQNNIRYLAFYGSRVDDCGRGTNSSDSGHGRMGIWYDRHRGVYILSSVANQHQISYRSSLTACRSRISSILLVSLSPSWKADAPVILTVCKFQMIYGGH